METRKISLINPFSSSDNYFDRIVRINNMGNTFDDYLTIIACYFLDLNRHKLL
jgi:hypothetical protein